MPSNEGCQCQTYAMQFNAALIQPGLLKHMPGLIKHLLQHGLTILLGVGDMREQERHARQRIKPLAVNSVVACRVHQVDQARGQRRLDGHDIEPPGVAGLLRQGDAIFMEAVEHGHDGMVVSARKEGLYPFVVISGSRRCGSEGITNLDAFVHEIYPVRQSRSGLPHG